MSTISKHVFGALARITSVPAARRRLVASLAGAALLGLVAADSSSAEQVHLPTNLAASGSWLNRLNLWRTATHLPPLSENTVWSNGDYSHSLYMVKNDLVTHYETPGVPYYTAAGDAAARNSNIQVSSTTNSTDDQAIDWWMRAPFHAMGMMDPRLQQTGFGAYREVKSGWQAGFTLDVLRGNSFTGGSYPVYFPGNGVTEPQTAYNGGEWPDPLQACPGYGVPSGLPLFIQLGGNVQTTASPGSSFTGNGVALAHCVIDSNNSAVGSYLYARGGVIVVPQQPLVTGVKYVVTVVVNGATYTWSFTVGPFSFCAPVNVSPGTASQLVGTSISFTAAATGCANPRYAYWAQYPDGSWNQLRTFAGPAFVWNTAGLGTGTYTVHVWANTSGTGYDAIGSATVTLTGCTSASLSPPTVSQAAGSTVNLTAGSGGCPNPTYELWVQDPGGTWTLKRGFGGPTFAWDTTGLAPGTYTVHAWANQTGAAPTLEVYGTSMVTLTGCASASVAPPTTSQSAGTTVNLTASSSGCPNPAYEFWVKDPSGSWSLKRGFGGPTFAWDTTGLAAGTYTVHAWANPSGAAPTLEVYGSSTVTLTNCTAASLAPSTVSQAAGSTVNLTAISPSCPNPTYEFWIQDPSGMWTLKQGFGGPSFAWDTSGLRPGTYTVHAWLSTTGSGHQAIGSATVTLTGCTSAALSPSSGSAGVGGKGTFTASSGGCPNPVYEFWLQYPNGTWHLQQAFSTNNKWFWDTTGFPKGTYVIHAWANQQGADTSFYETIGQSIYTLF